MKRVVPVSPLARWRFAVGCGYFAAAVMLAYTVLLTVAYLGLGPWAPVSGADYVRSMLPGRELTWT